MFGFVHTGGKQFRVESGAVIRVEKREEPPGTLVTLNDVLMLHNQDKTLLGNPVIPNAKVEATIVEHTRDPKVLVFKKKRRKNYRRKKGHIQPKTILRIENILLNDK